MSSYQAMFKIILIKQETLLQFRTFTYLKQDLNSSIFNTFQLEINMHIADKTIKRKRKRKNN